MRPLPAPGSTIVVKVGSSSLAGGGGGLDDGAVERVVSQVEGVWGRGHPTLLVTSGAVAAGLPEMGYTERPGDLVGLQVAAAVGQGRLMEQYATKFAARDRVVGQVLLTRDVLARREQYLHAREALQRMLGLGIVPIVNENDTVLVDELKFGDNDRLAAIVAHLVSAAMLIILTDTPGLFSDDPGLSDDAELLTAVRHTDEILDHLLDRSSSGGLGSGGAATKISAARMASWSGIPTVVAAALNETAAVAAVSGKEIGTWIEPHDSKLTAKKLWIAFGLPASGRLIVDAGAIAAVTQHGGSLLPAGVTEVDGEFASGSAVEIVTSDGSLVGKGLAGLSANELRAALGSHSSQAGGEAIHRDDLVVLI